VGDNQKPWWLSAAPFVALLTLGMVGCGNPLSEADGEAAATTDGSAPAESSSLAIDNGEVADSSSDITTEAFSADNDVVDDPLPEVDPGWLVWVHHQEPPDLHFDDPDNSTNIASWVRQGLLEGLFGVDSTLSYYPELLAGEPSVTVNGDRTVTINYQLRSGLRWSDGEPLTAHDVEYTHRVLVEGCAVEGDGSIVDVSDDGCFYEREGRLGYDLVTNFEVVDDTTFTIRMASFFAGWRDMYSQVFAEHAFGAGALAVNDSLEQWNNGTTVLPSSGPVIFESWERGQSLRLARNPQYHGTNSPEAVNRGGQITFEGVVILFEADDARRQQYMVEGVGHIMMAPLNSDQATLLASQQIMPAVRPGPVFEHLGMNLLDPHLNKVAVREAIAYAIDKRAIVAAVFTPLVGPDGVAADGLGNLYWMPNHPAYQDHQLSYAGADLGASARLLEEAGYQRGGDGVWVHAEDGRLSLKLGTTSGDSIRDAEVSLIGEQLEAAGFEVQDGSAVGGLFYQQALFASEAMDAALSRGRSGNSDLWDLAVFSWSTGPWPGALSGVFRGGSAANPYGLDEPRVNVKATECDGLADPVEQAACYNELDQLLLVPGEIDGALVVVPISQRPYLFAYNTERLGSVGVVPGIGEGGPLVNLGDFAVNG